MPIRSMLLMCLCLTPPTPVVAEPARIAVAISLKEAMTGVAEAYKAEGRGEVAFTFGSSGQLQAQIEYGADIDAFISAAHKQVDELATAKRAEAGSKRVIAGNRLVLIVPADSRSPPSDFADLANARHRRVAVGEPRSVPAGQYAVQALRSIGVADALKRRLVYGANVRQVLDYVERGEVDAGIVYATDAKESGAKVRVIDRADPRTHDRIEYPAVFITDSRRREAAEAFLDYLAGEKARAILEKRVFTTPDRSSARERPRE